MDFEVISDLEAVFALKFIAQNRLNHVICTDSKQIYSFCSVIFLYLFAFGSFSGEILNKTGLHASVVLRRSWVSLISFTFVSSQKGTTGFEKFGLL